LGLYLTEAFFLKRCCFDAGHTPMIRTHREANEFIAKKKAEFATQAPGFGDRE